MRRMVISAETLERANEAVRSQVLPCKFCMRKLTVETSVTLDVRRALPEEIEEMAREQRESVPKSSSA